MKVYTTDDKELIMEPSIKWAGNPNIIIAVTAYGLKATIQVFASVMVELRERNMHDETLKKCPVVYTLCISVCSPLMNRY